MAPAFFLIFFALPVAALGTLGLFGLLKAFTPVRRAWILAPVLIGSGGIGLIAGAVIQLPFRAGTLTTPLQVWSFLGVILLGGLAFFGFTLWAAMQVPWFSPAKSSSPAARSRRTRHP
jgi:hypothetical protein